MKCVETREKVNYQRSLITLCGFPAPYPVRLKVLVLVDSPLTAQWHLRAAAIPVKSYPLRRTMLKRGQTSAGYGVKLPHYQRANSLAAGIIRATAASIYTD